MHLQRPLSGYYYKLFENNPPCVIINSDGTLQPSSSSRKKPRRRPSSLSLLDVPARFLKKRIITCQSAKLFHPHQKQQENIISMCVVRFKEIECCLFLTTSILP